MQRSKLTYFALFAVTAVFAVGMTGCGAESGDPTSGDNAPAAQDVEAVEQSTQGEASSNESASTGEAVLKYGDLTYTAELSYCSLTENEDALFHGPAYDEASAEVGYLDGDFGIHGADAIGEARIDFGATGNLQSSDEFVAIGDAMSAIVITAASDTGWYIIGSVWDEQGTMHPNASLQVSC